MTAALIIAAGRTANTEGFQPLKMVGVISAVQRSVAVFRRAGIERIVLVAGVDAQKIEKRVSNTGVVCLRVSDPENAEMFDCVKAGLSYLMDKCQNVLIGPVDTPLFSIDTINALTGSGAMAAVPVHCEKTGHPLLLDMNCVSEILEYKGSGGLEGALASTNVRVERVAVPDEGVLIDVERDEEYKKLLEHHDLRRLHPDIIITLACEKSFFGDLSKQLLEFIKETGSIRLACQRAGMSYSKGWKMLADMEEQLGFQLISSRQGGKSGGSSALTEKGDEFLSRYSGFCAEVKSDLQEIFDKYFFGFQN